MIDTTPVRTVPDQLAGVLNGRRVWIKRRPELAARIRRLHELQGASDIHVWEGHGFLVISTFDRTHHGQLRHVSISRTDRHPTWNEIMAVRQELFADDTDVMMVMPKSADYINIHEHCFHLWQTPADWGVQ